jgi:threonine synthase
VSSNINPAYASFRLDLSTAGKVSLKEVTGETFTGNYTVTQQSLTLSDLSPEPTGSGGTLSFSITSIDEDGKNLVLTATQGNPKTGNSVNVYTLVAN